jgi:hypothetical protein
VASLDEAYRRVRQSRKRLTDLRDRVEGLRQGHPSVVAVKRRNPNKFEYPVSDPLLDLSIDISEVVQHLVIALNYLVVALSELRGRKIDESLQFPICDTPEAFKRRVPSELKGIGKKEVAMIELLQPYPGRNDWLRKIRDLANPDRHRKPTAISTGGRTLIHGHALSHFKAKTSLGQIVFMPETVEMKYCFTEPIVFSETRSPVIETLQILQLKVADVLDTFKPLFDEM